MTIVDLSAVRMERTPHVSGEARCLDCRHEWIAVAQLGAVWLQCPSCLLTRGRLIGHVSKPGQHWHCGCGCDLFHATPEGMYCPNCGESQRGF